jgi:peptide/nickel transport system ATP-binding protein
MNVPILQVNDLKTFYKTRFGDQVHAVDGVSFDLKAGSKLGIAGESGCGKSTLALSLMGYFMQPLHLKSGTIVVSGNEVTRMSKEDIRTKILGKEIAYIPQAAMNVLNPTGRVKKFVSDVLREHRPELTQKDVMDLAAERFEMLGLERRVLEAYPHELSGGMKQRTVVAISTIMNPKVLIADEPTSALDVSSQKLVIKLIDQLMNADIVKSLIFITHELPLLYHVTDEILVMYAGEIVERGTSKELIFDAYHPYSQALMNAIVVPEIGMKNKQLSAIPGAPPNLKFEITGCRYAERCSYVTPACRLGKIDTLSVENRTYRCLRTLEEVKSV